MIFTSQLGMLDGKTEKEAIASIANHLRRMQEELEYRLCVLDSSNITEITAGSTKIKTEDGKDLVNLILGSDGAMSAMEQTVNGLKVTVNSNQKGINDMQTKFVQTDKDISMVVDGLFKDGKLSAASIVAAINQTTGDSIVKIDADHIVLNGDVIAKSLQSQGKIEGVYFATKLETDSDPGTVVIDSEIRFGNYECGIASKIVQNFLNNNTSVGTLEIISESDIVLRPSGYGYDYRFYRGNLTYNGGILHLRGSGGTRMYGPDGGYLEFNSGGLGMYYPNGNLFGWVQVQ